jgi:hypothetical protein
LPQFRFGDVAVGPNFLKEVDQSITRPMEARFPVLVEPLGEAICLISGNLAVFEDRVAEE